MMNGRVIQLDKSGAMTPTELTTITATTTSAAKTAKGHNAIIIYFGITAGSGAWTIKIQGSHAHNGTFKDMYDSNGNLMSTGSISANRAQIFVGIPEHFKIVATEDTNGATVTINYELLTV